MDPNYAANLSKFCNDLALYAGCNPYNQYHGSHLNSQCRQAIGMQLYKLIVAYPDSRAAAEYVALPGESPRNLIVVHLSCTDSFVLR